MSKIVRKTLGMAVLDSAYSQTVAGRLWFDIFFDMLNDQDKCFVKTAKSSRIFCFGVDGVKSVRVYIEADSKNDLPLLLSHKSIKTAGMLLDLKNDS